VKSNHIALQDPAFFFFLPSCLLANLFNTDYWTKNKSVLPSSNFSIRTFRVQSFMRIIFKGKTPGPLLCVFPFSFNQSSRYLLDK
jgi:hypothetical protein